MAKVKRRILVVDDVQTSTTMMTYLFKRAGYDAIAKNNPVDALKWLQSLAEDERPDIIISDLNMPQMSGNYFVRRIRSDAANARIGIIMLSAMKDKDSVVGSMQAGADDYLVKPINSRDLLSRVEILLKREVKTRTRPEEPKVSAAVLSVFSLKGGAGVSTLAVNLAVAMAKLWGKETVLLDATAKNSHCGILLGLSQPTTTLAQLAEINTVSATVIEKALTRHATGVKLLAAPVSPIKAELVKAKTIGALWPHLNASYPVVVVDAGSELRENTLAVLDNSTKILVVVTPEKGGVQAAANALQVFKQLEYPDERIALVLNQTIAEGGLLPSDIEAALQQKIACIIPHNQVAAMQAWSGQPFVEQDAASEISLAIAGMAYQLSPPRLKDNPPETPSDLLTAVQPVAAPVG